LAIEASFLGLDCHKCTEESKIYDGCESDSPVPDVWQIRSIDWKSQRCPLKVVTRQSQKFLQAYFFFSKGYLPSAGGWLEQSTRFIEAMETIETSIKRIESEEQNKVKKKIGKKPNANK